MAEILNINTPQDAKEAAQNVVQSIRDKTEKRKFELEEALKQIAKVSPNDGGFEEIAIMMSLPDEHFQVLAPAFLHELEKNYHNIND